MAAISTFRIARLRRARLRLDCLRSSPGVAGVGLHGLEHDRLAHALESRFHHPMDLRDLESVADGAYADAGLDIERPHVMRLAIALLGPGSIRRGPRPIHGPAALLRVGDAWRIVLSRSLPQRYALFAIAHELGHWLIARHGLVGAAGVGDDEERAADYLGGALLAPRRAFLAARRALGDDLSALAKTFSTTETGAALRLGEVLRLPLAVVAPQTVRVRGPEDWVWPDESTLRRWARRPAPGLRKTRLTDDPRRVVLDADETA